MDPIARLNCFVIVIHRKHDELKTDLTTDIIPSERIYNILHL
jgi:hypothetical protein